MIKYTIAMSIRVLCIFLMLFVQGWWLVVCAAGAIFLPYIAVVLANVGGGEQGVVERPGSIEPVARLEAAETPGDSPVEGAPEAQAGSGPDASPEASPDASSGSGPDASSGSSPDASSGADDDGDAGSASAPSPAEGDR